jgi:hypothetical protein
MIRLIVREENDHRLGHAQCAGILRPVARFHMSVGFPPFLRRASGLRNTDNRYSPAPIRKQSTLLNTPPGHGQIIENP